METEKKKSQSFKRVIDNNLFILRYFLKYTPAYLIVSILLTVLGSLITFFEHVYAIKYITDTIQYGRPFMNVVIYIGIIFIAVFIKLAFSSWYYHVLQLDSAEKLKKMIRADLYDKAVKLDLKCYDDPEFYNVFVWSTSEIATRTDLTMSYVIRLSDSLVWIISSGALMLALDKVGFIFILVSFILTLLTSMALNKLKFKMEIELKPKQRKMSYIHRVFYLTDYAKEIRLNPVKGKLKTEYAQTNKDIMDTIHRHSRKQVLLGFLHDYVFNSFILDSLYILYLFFIAAVKKAISFGSAIALFNSAWQVKRNLSNISTLIPELQQNSLNIERIRAFMDYKSTVVSPEGAEAVPAEPAELELRNVTFRYKSDGEPVLKNISLKIKPGEKIALVGYIGAGKTTLTKLIMRLYDISEGVILLDGKPIQDYDLESYRSAFGSVFQDYQVFAASIAENVKMDTFDESDEQEITTALRSSGFQEKLSQLPLGIQTPLTREFNDEGVNLSGGEAQKVALARVFAKPCQIILLDEPSSALDPISEYHLNEAMLEAAKHKTIIFISHRLSSTRMADKIYMLSEGEIIEEGTHEELMAKGGRYAEMFTLQAENYKIFSPSQAG